MKILVLLLATVSRLAAAETATVRHPDELPPIAVSPGVILKELTGRSATGPMKSDRCSVAYFVLEPGRASAWSFNKVGEESFFILNGHGEVWTGGEAHAVRPGSFILVPATVVRSVRASQGETLEFYAVTAPAWSSDDDVITTAPVGAPR